VLDQEPNQFHFTDVLSANIDTSYSSQITISGLGDEIEIDANFS
jgi:hypothetical protein